MTDRADMQDLASHETGQAANREADGEAGPDAEDASAARARADALQRRLDAVQALLAEERRDAEALLSRRSEYEEAAALRDELARVRAQLAAAQREVRAVRASSTFRAGLAVKRVATPILAARRTVRRTVRRGARPVVRAAVRRGSGR